MALIVQKFGGTSVGSIERIQSVAQRVLERQAKGDSIIVVVSAMAGETNRLVALAHQINAIPFSREYDMLIASGEQVAVGLVSLAINTRACDPLKARPLLGHQIGIVTDSVFSKARIKAINTRLLEAELARGGIPVIAGFQGVDIENNITTLGRGGSDTSAVAIAAAIRADECEIYTDVDGIYTTDPRLCEKARKLDVISFEEMMEMASLGAKVLQIRSVELAAKHGVSLHVRSSFSDEAGTRVVPRERLGGKMEQVIVSGVALDLSQTKLTVKNLLDSTEATASLFASLSKAAIVVDIIVQHLAQDGLLNISFTVPDADAEKAMQVLQILKRDFPGATFEAERALAKVSVVGVGMQHHPGVASKMFQVLASVGARIHLITTSEIKISCLVDANQAQAAVRGLHEGFELDRLS